MCRFGGRNLQQRELLPIFTAFPFNRPGPGASFGEPLRSKGMEKRWKRRRAGRILCRRPAEGLAARGSFPVVSGDGTAAPAGRRTPARSCSLL